MISSKRLNCYLIGLVVCLLNLIVPTLSKGQTLKVVSYNLLNYPSASNFNVDTTTRNPYFRTVLQSLQPDVLVTQEVNNSTGVNLFLNNVLNTGVASYSSGSFNDGPDTDNAIFFKNGLFTFISNTPIRTALRDISEFKLIYLPTGDTIRFYSVHLKASAGSPNDTQRGAEVDSLRKVTNSLPAGSKFFVCGDFNIYNSSEIAYTKLLAVQAGAEGQFYDALSLTGSWNNSLYAIHHTQSPRVRQFDGGSTGGMDDRFDMILFSKAIHDGVGMAYQSGSLSAYGNDGNHYNDSINHQPNTAVSVAIANALHYAADHIPIVANFDITSLPTDISAIDFIPPTLTSCSNTNKTLTVRITNSHTNTLNFSNTPTTVGIKITTPSNATQTLTTSINTGTLTSGSSIDVIVTSTYNFNEVGNYLFKGFASVSGDINISNDSAATEVLNSPPAFTASITPSGAITICNGSTATLTASSGVSYLWSTGATTQSVSVNSAGSYSVTVTNGSGCTSTTSPTVVTVSSGASTNTLFYESMGIPSATTLITAYETANGFDNDIFTMSGSGDVRTTSTSTGQYAGASGGGNVFLTSGGTRNFIIDGINTVGKNNMSISLGIWRSLTSNTGSDLQISVSTDGVNYTALSFTAFSGTGQWQYRTLTGNIPQTSNLRLQFKNLNTGSIQYRVDDIVMVYTQQPSITSSGALSICVGDSLTLTATSGTNYLWNTGATTQSIVVTTPGAYHVKVDCIASDTTQVVAGACAAIINLKVFIQGFYVGGGMMQPVLYINGISTDITDCDSIQVGIYSSTAPYNLVEMQQTVLKTNGTCSITATQAMIGGSYYIAIRHRNSIETWSKWPIVLSGTQSYDFTVPE